MYKCRFRSGIFGVSTLHNTGTVQCTYNCPMVQILYSSNNMYRYVIYVCDVELHRRVYMPYHHSRLKPRDSGHQHTQRTAMLGKLGTLHTHTYTHVHAKASWCCSSSRRVAGPTISLWIARGTLFARLMVVRMDSVGRARSA